MHRLVDLDEVAVELAGRRASWVAAGLVVGEFTWRDASAGWPKPITADRTSVVDPESLGIRFQAEDDHEVELVLWTGGWADLDGIVDDQIIAEGPEFTDVESCIAVVETLAARMVELVHRGPSGQTGKD